MENPVATREIRLPCIGTGSFELIAAITAAEKEVQECTKLVLNCRHSASINCEVFADALRYLARQRGIPFAAYRPQPEQAPPAEIRSGSMENKGRRPVILVTGAAGQIGRAMIRLLDRRQITHLDIDLEAPKTGGASFLRCDFLNPNRRELRDFCRPATHVIHLAGRVSRSQSLAQSYLEQYSLSVEGTRTLLEALPSTLSHFCFASTIAIYGSPRAAFISESEPAQPNCVHALCKLAAERHLRRFREKTGLPVALLRYSSAYGPGPMPDRAISVMIKDLLNGQPPQINGAGALRDYIYLEDLCEATLRACLRESDDVLNVGTGIGTSTLELAEMLVRVTGSAHKPLHVRRPLDARTATSLVYDISKMRRALEFAPRISLEAGLREMVQHSLALEVAA